MPRTLLGISGLNIYNIMLLGVLIGFYFQNAKEKLQWQIPKWINFCLIVYIVVFIIAFLRMEFGFSDYMPFYQTRGTGMPSRGSFFIDYFINPLRWFLPFLLFCYGASTPERQKFGMYAIVATATLFALQIISRMMPALIGGDDLAERALRVLDRNIGYHRVDLAALMAGSAWAVFSLRLAINNWLVKNALLGLFVVITLALLLTGGRTGYAAWGGCGFMLMLLRWRGWLTLAPFGLVLALTMVPGLWERMTEGFTEESHSGYAQQGKGDISAVDDSGRDLYAITSGRITVWPSVINKISEAPLNGYGFHAFRRLDMNRVIEDEYGFAHPVGHPHNAYLQYALDNGVPALIIVLMFFGLVSLRAFGIFLDKSSPPVHQALAGMTLSFAACHAVASMGSQSFYPTQGSVLMWCAFGLFLAAVQYQERSEASSVGAVQKSRWEAYRKPQLHG